MFANRYEIRFPGPGGRGLSWPGSSWERRPPSLTARRRCAITELRSGGPRRSFQV